MTGAPLDEALALRTEHAFAMENNGGGVPTGRWQFGPNAMLANLSSSSIRAVLNPIIANVQADDPRPMLHLGHGDPSSFPSFGTTPVAVDAIVDAVRSGTFNCYAPTAGIPPAKRAVAEYLSRDLPYKVSPGNIFLTSGCSQAIEIVLFALARPGANILLPRPGFPLYKARAGFCGLEARYFDLIPEKGWEIDLEAVEALADENTVAMVIINPGNPCGNVFIYKHLEMVAKTAKRLGILVIADEVYDHLTFGSNPFVPMAVFANIVPVLTLGSISKRWLVPGWRLGWILMGDPNGILKEHKIDESITTLLNITTDPATFIQGAIPSILEKTKDDFFQKTIDILKKAADMCYDKFNEIDCITCPCKPEGSMFVMVKLNSSYLEDIHDDFDFCYKLAKEESLIILPGATVGLTNWLRVTFAADLSSLEDGLGRLESFCQRHAKENK